MAVNLKYPVALAVSAALLLALICIAVLRLVSPAEPGNGATEAVDVGAIWNAALPDLAGNRQPIAQWRDKVLVLNFWAPWCPPCREEIPGFIRLQRQYGERGLQFVGIALDSAEKVRAYADEVGITYPLLVGGASASELAHAAGNRLGGLPYTVVLDRRGAPIATITGGIDEARMEAMIKPLL
jgi:thiol-disulfide isomerase/thioredoxin